MLEFKKVQKTDAANAELGLKEEIDPQYKASEDFFWNMHNQEDGWNKKTEFKKDDLSAIIHARPVPGYSMDWSRVRTTFANCTLDCFEDLFKNIDEIYKKKPDMSEAKTLEYSQDGFPSLMYFKIKMPMFITNRDMLLSLVRKQVADKKVLYLMQSVDR